MIIKIQTKISYGKNYTLTRGYQFIYNKTGLTKQLTDPVTIASLCGKQIKEALEAIFQSWTKK